MSAPPAAHDGAQAQARQVRYLRCEGELRWAEPLTPPPPPCPNENLESDLPKSMNEDHSHTQCLMSGCKRVLHHPIIARLKALALPVQ